jgi:hypothetical protein
VTTAVNSSAAILSAVAVIIGSNNVPAAITQVDALAGCKFTADVNSHLYKSSRMWEKMNPSDLDLFRASRAEMNRM